MEQTLINSELFRFLIQVVAVALAVAGAYYKLQKDISIITMKITEIEQDRLRRWCAYDAVTAKNQELLSAMREDIAVIKNTIKFYIEERDAGNKHFKEGKL